MTHDRWKFYNYFDPIPYIAPKVCCMNNGEREKGENSWWCWALEKPHTTYIINNMRQKCESNYGSWVLNEMIEKIYPENLKKIVGAVWELTAKKHNQSSPIWVEMGWIGYAF